MAWRRVPAARPPRGHTVRARAVIVHGAAAYIAERIADAVRLEDCARALYTSPRQLQRALSDHGTTWRRLLRDIRMREAARQLGGLDRPVGEVAGAVGYADPGQFAKTFRRVYGVPPSRYSEWARSYAPTDDHDRLPRVTEGTRD
jgi:AraC-like DNA-binding protein